jgi:hypothetical protein
MNVPIVVVGVIVIVVVVAAGTYYAVTREKVSGEPGNITISGTVSYDDYDKGEIFIGAFENREALESMGDTIDAVSLLWGPGAYLLTIPANSGEVWIGAIYDANDDGVFAVGAVGGEPRGEYTGNPLTVGTENIKNVNITLQPGGLF